MKRLEAAEIFQDRDVIVMRAGHPLAAKSVVSLTDLSEQTWILSLALSEQWKLIAGVFLAAGLPAPSNIIDLDSVVLAKALIAQTDGVALLARELVSREVERNEFATLERPDLPSARPAYLTVRRGSDPHPAANAFKSDLLHVCKEIY